MVPPDTSDQDPPDEPVTDLSPEARRRAALGQEPVLRRMLQKEVGPGTHAFAIGKRVVIGSYTDGFIHAGNLAYMAMLAIFPFFLTGAAIFSAIGEEGERAATIEAVLVALPPVVGEVIGPAAREVVNARSGVLLWISGLFGLWTVGSLIETIRDILRRAYGTRATKAFWQYRLLSAGIIVGAVLLLLLSLIAQFLIGTIEQFIDAFLPQLTDALSGLGWSRVVPTLGLFGSLYALFYSLTPAAYRHRRYPKWPGALLVTAWWSLVTLSLPPLLRTVFSYDMTYGSLAGMMIALFFFWLVGLGMVMGAELNAALAETPEEERDRVGQADNRARAESNRDGTEKNAS